jgi:hypothetical protein
MKLTDRKAIRIALHIAIDTEEALIDAYRNSFTGQVPEEESGVIIARRNVTAFKRCLQRYYGEGGNEYKPKAGESVSIFELMKNPDKDNG